MTRPKLPKGFTFRYVSPDRYQIINRQGHIQASLFLKEMPYNCSLELAYGLWVKYKLRGAYSIVNCLIDYAEREAFGFSYTKLMTTTSSDIYENDPVFARVFTARRWTKDSFLSYRNIRTGSMLTTWVKRIKGKD